MKEYYEEKVALAEKLLELTKGGFTESMAEYGEKLKSADFDEAVKIVGEIQLLIKAVEEMQGNLAYAQERLQTETDKESEDKES